MQIDLVYLWVDGSDQKWQANRDRFLPAKEQQRADTHSVCRYIDNEELRYSLRSVELYAPWINHIYIVTDNQRPTWLNIDHPKITIIDHTSILPINTLPTFNSVAIELGIINIPSLSEHFLIANDDTMFTRQVTPEEFITQEGVMRSRFNIRSLSSEELQSAYGEQIFRANEEMSKEFGIDYHCTLPHHNIDIYAKSLIRELCDNYPQWVEQTLESRFRSPLNMQRHIFSLYALATKRAEAINVRKGVYLKALKRLVTPQSGIESMVLNLPLSLFDTLRFRVYNPAMICINDNERTKSHDRSEATRFMARLYPTASSFEI